MLRKMRKLKMHNPKKETNQHVTSIHAKATMTTTASSDNHDFANDCNAN